MNKIKVDPLTFKIINNSKSETILSSEDSLSEESLTSINSETDTIKVIKLDNSEQSGGSNVGIKNSQQPLQSNPNSVLKPFSSPFPSSQSTQNPVSKNVESYLQTNSRPLNPESTINETSISKSSDESESTKEESPPPEIQEKESPEESPDVIDLTKSQLFDILYNIFTSKKGSTISESIENTNKLFETHNQIMEKILNQLVIMNTNLSKVPTNSFKYTKVPSVPENVQRSTNLGQNIKDFREKIIRTT